MNRTFPGIETVLFDVDGTLLDTTEFIFQAYENATAGAGLEVPGREWLRHQIGRKLEAVYEDLAAERVPELVERHRTFQATNLELSFPFAGAGDTLATLRGRGFALAAVTSRSNRSSVKTLELAGLAHHFETIISAEDARALKPDPAPLALAMERLGRHPSGAVMVGDATHDLEAARAFGIPIIAATYGFPGRTILEHNPDAWIDAIGDLPALFA